MAKMKMVSLKLTEKELKKLDKLVADAKRYDKTATRSSTIRYALSKLPAHWWKA